MRPLRQLLAFLGSAPAKAPAPAVQDTDPIDYDQLIPLDAERLARAGMPVSTAVDRLERDGFRCDTTSQAPAIDCSRAQHGAVLATCIERVLLQPDAAGRRVDAATVPPIACAGL